MSKTVIMDVGTNSIKAYAFVDGKCLYRNKLENHLGEGMAENQNQIKDEAVERTIFNINALKLEMREFMPAKIAAFGTEAFRKAENCQEVLAEILKRTGVAIQVLSAQDELEYCWKGLVKSFDWNGQIAAIDIGGGSVQFMYGTKDKLEAYHHLKTGALFMRQKFIKSEPALLSEYEAVEAEIARAIADINVKFAPGTPFVHGASSVIDFYTEAKLPLQEYGYSMEHPYKLMIEDSEAFYDKIRLAEKEDRRAYFPSQPGFMDGAPIGLAHIIAIARKTGLEFEVPSNHNLIHGFLDD